MRKRFGSEGLTRMQPARGRIQTRLVLTKFWKVRSTVALHLASRLGTTFQNLCLASSIPMRSLCTSTVPALISFTCFFLIIIFLLEKTIFVFFLYNPVPCPRSQATARPTESSTPCTERQTGRQRETDRQTDTHTLEPKVRYT